MTQPTLIRFTYKLYTMDLQQHTFEVLIDGTVWNLFAEVEDTNCNDKNDYEAIVESIDPQIDDMDGSTAEAAAFQCVLRSVVKDLDAPAHERVTAHFLSLWIGTTDVDVMHLDSERPWLVKVIAGFVQKYPLTSKNCSSVTLQEAYDSVIYIFESIGTEGIQRVRWALLVDDI